MVMFGVTPFGNKSFVSGDAYHQVFPLLTVMHDKMQNGGSMLYYWNSGLGGDYLPSYFYYLASPFNLLVVLCRKSDINAFISIMIALKISLSACFFGYYVSRRNGVIENKPMYVAFSVAYALSSYMCNYYIFIFWLDSLMVFPLIMLGFDRLVNEKKPALYVISLAYSLYCNYYISYIICLFLVLWFLVDEYKDIKDFISRGLRFSFFSILSAGLSAIAIIPSYIGLTKTASVNEEMISHKWFGNIFAIIRHMFIFTNSHKATFVDNVAHIYCGTFALLFIFVYCFIKDISLSKKIKTIVLMLVLLISMNESILNFVWHGFHKQHSVPNRFAFLFVFLLLYVASDCIDHVKNNGKTIIIGMIPAMLLPVISYIFIDFDSSISSYELILLTEILILIYSVLTCVISMKDGRIKKLSNVVLSSIMIIELCFNAFLILNVELINIYNLNTFVDHIDEVYDIKDSDEFYRSDINEGIIYNENAYHGMNGVGVFNSTVNGNVTLFMKAMGAHIGINCVLNYQVNDILNDILNVKYIYAYSVDSLYEDNTNYEKIYYDDVFSLYQNKYPLSLGYGVDSRLKNFAYQDFYDMSKNINMLSSEMAGGIELISSVIPEYKFGYTGCELGIGDTDYFSIEYSETGEPKNITISFNPPEEGLYYMDVREDNEDFISLKVNDELIRESIRMTNGFNRIGYISPDDKVDIIISDNTGIAYQNNADTSEVKVFVYKIDEEALKHFYDVLSKHQMTVSDFRDTSFKATVSLDKNQLLFTSIPYDKGWHVYENGKELETVKLAETFLGLDIGEGEHELTFRFIPEGLYMGIIISIISLMIFIIVLLVSKKKDKVD